jgi:hypothetical protein
MKTVNTYCSKQSCLAGVLLLCLFVVNSSNAQEEEKREIWKIKGYIKELPYISFDKNFTNVYATNIIHNRFNVKWTPNTKLSGAAEFRTRFFWGDDVRSTPNFSEQMRNRNEQVDASITWFETEDAAMITNIERFWLELPCVPADSASTGALPLRGILTTFLTLTIFSILTMRKGPAVMR